MLESRQVVGKYKYSITFPTSITNCPFRPLTSSKSGRIRLARSAGSCLSSRLAAKEAMGIFSDMGKPSKQQERFEVKGGGSAQSAGQKVNSSGLLGCLEEAAFRSYS